MRVGIGVFLSLFFFSSSLVGATPLTLQQLSQQKGLVAPELLSLVSDQKTLVELSESSVLSDYYKEWNKGETVEYLESGTLSSFPARWVGIPFISQEGNIGAKSVWNADSWWWGEGLFQAEGKLFFVEKDSISGSIGIRIQRIVNSSFPQQFPVREKFEVITPGTAKGYSFLTVRGLGNKNLKVWSYSPLTKSLREFRPENRSDALFASALSLNDLFTTSSRPEEVNVLTEEVKELYLPFAPERSEKGESTDECLSASQLPFLKDNTTRFSFDKFLASGRFIKRKVRIVELGSNSPFTVWGRARLFLDAETSLPVLKILYDIHGSPYKVVLTLFQIVEFEKANPRLRATPVQQWQSDLQLNADSIIAFDKVTWCDTPPEAKQFEPRSLIPPDGAPTPTPAPVIKTPSAEVEHED